MKYKKLACVLNCDFYIADREGRKILSVDKDHCNTDLMYGDDKVKSVEMERNSDNPRIVVRLDFISELPKKLIVKLKNDDASSTSIFDEAYRESK